MMSWIDTVEPAAAGEELTELYERTRDRVTGRLDNIMRVHGLHPAGLAAHYELYTAVMRPTRSLRKAEREMIALTVSGINGCHY